VSTAHTQTVVPNAKNHMKTSLHILTFLLISSISFAQEKAVEVIYTQDEDGFTFSAKNNRNVQHELTLTITPTNLKGYKKPITKLVPANSTVDITKLYLVPNKKGSFKYSYSFQPKMTADEKMDQEKKLAEKTLSEIGDINKGIVVFSKDGCPRCHFTTTYLLDNNIDFKFINTSDSQDQNRLMWDLLRKDNPQLSSITMPVILVDGKISYNIQDLKETVSKLNP
jgi:glutaredoxin